MHTRVCYARIRYAPPLHSFTYYSLLSLPPCSFYLGKACCVQIQPHTFHPRTRLRQANHNIDMQSQLHHIITFACMQGWGGVEERGEKRPNKGDQPGYCSLIIAFAISCLAFPSLSFSLLLTAFLFASFSSRIFTFFLPPPPLSFKAASRSFFSISFFAANSSCSSISVFLLLSF
mmetsp:Transcript_16378/g.41549  ORF Transcript_16378/g.41549 Transcript_16378/m.41549 type:complete len:175 (+) Transcript_16378:459-983(+)